MRLVALVMSACLLAACAPKATTQAPPVHASPVTIASPTPAPSPAAAPAHVFLIVMENRSYSQAISSGYVAQLAAQYSIATNYHGVSHPSLPNYLALTSGTTGGNADDGFHALPAGGPGTQLTNAGIDWRAYMPSM